MEKAIKLPKEKIKELVKKELNSYLAKKTTKTKDGLYLAIQPYLSGSSYTLSKSDFSSRLSKFEADLKKSVSFEEASDSFLTFLDVPSEPELAELQELKAESKKPKHFEGFKYTKERKFLKELWDVLNYSRSSKSFKRNLHTLIRYKSYLAEKAMLEGKKQSDDYEYICQIFGIPLEEYNSDPKIREDVSEINRIVKGWIVCFRMALGLISKLIREKPYTKKWVIDVFSKATRYNNPIEKFKLQGHKRKSHNEPNYKTSREVFIKFINGTPRERLGVDYSNFYKRIYPQGLITFLRDIHELLNRMVDDVDQISEMALVSLKLVQTNEILSTLPPHLKERYFNELPLLRESPSK
ncbi:MAG: hypothetical protein AB1478_09500 [Nitrospirota bacterium]